MMLIFNKWLKKNCTIMDSMGIDNIDTAESLKTYFINIEKSKNAWINLLKIRCDLVSWKEETLVKEINTKMQLIKKLIDKAKKDNALTYK